MKKKERKILYLLTVAVLLLGLSISMVLSGEHTVKSEYYEAQVQAAQQMERCMRAVRAYKQELGIPVGEEDIHRTGLIGQSYTEITTTLGALEAKRTTAWPDMAALCVRLLHEAGVRAGDTVGAGFSGSFPGMNLAMITACESMGVTLKCIPSVGASTYGANDPELTFPEMMCLLEQDGWIKTEIAVATMGGGDDVGREMPGETVAAIQSRLQEFGVSIVKLPEFSDNLSWREEYYGPIDCFVAVGGNVTSLGRTEDSVSLGQGVLKADRTMRLAEGSGLVQRYCAAGIPVINLLNIKFLAAEYGLPYDPVEWPEIGRSAVYSVRTYPKLWIVFGGACVCGMLLACYWTRGGKTFGARGENSDERRKAENLGDR